MHAEVDPVLRRLERTAAAVCGLMALAALGFGGGRWEPAAGVLGGGLLIAVSYRTIGAGVSGLAEAIARPRDPADDAVRAPRIGRTVLVMAGRYALLALLAYVMIARLRLHPLGLLAGASSIVAAVTVEAVRLFVKKS